MVVQVGGVAQTFRIDVDVESYPRRFRLSRVTVDPPGRWRRFWAMPGRERVEVLGVYVLEGSFSLQHTKRLNGPGSASIRLDGRDLMTILLDSRATVGEQ